MLTSLAKQVLARYGYVVRKRQANELLGDMEPAFLELYERVKAFTMTSVTSLYALYQATQYVTQMNLPGDLVECGVWRGGSCMMMALTLLRMGVTDRNIRLFDTFDGMSEPTDADVDVNGRSARLKWDKTGHGKQWCNAGLDEVRKNMAATGYPVDRLMFVPGKVEDTLPLAAPEGICLLRLDTDWYESTRCELNALYPRLCRHGVLLLDDYGHWQGVRAATDEYFALRGERPLLTRINEDARITIKLVAEAETKRVVG